MPTREGGKREAVLMKKHPPFVSLFLTPAQQADSSRRLPPPPTCFPLTKLVLCHYCELRMPHSV